MIEYIVSFAAFGLFLALESQMKKNRKRLWFFSTISGILGIVGLVSFNMTNINVLRYFEYFCILIIVTSAINIHNLCKKTWTCKPTVCFEMRGNWEYAKRKYTQHKIPYYVQHCIFRPSGMVFRWLLFPKVWPIGSPVCGRSVVADLFLCVLGSLYQPQTKEVIQSLQEYSQKACQEGKPSWHVSGNAGSC